MPDVEPTASIGSLHSRPAVSVLGAGLVGCLRAHMALARLVVRDRWRWVVVDAVERPADGALAHARRHTCPPPLVGGGLKQEHPEPARSLVPGTDPERTHGPEPLPHRLVCRAHLVRPKLEWKRVMLLRRGGLSSTAQAHSQGHRWSSSAPPMPVGSPTRAAVPRSDCAGTRHCQDSIGSRDASHRHSQSEDEG